MSSRRCTFCRRAGFVATALTGLLVAAPLAAGESAPLRVFVTSTDGNGVFGTGGGWDETFALGGLTGIEGADKICQIRAEAAGLADSGTHQPVFRAWLSDSSVDAYCHVQGLTGNRLNFCSGTDNGSVAGPYYRTDDVPFIDRLSNVTGSILGTLSRDENGTFRSALAWTGSNNDGGATGSTCTNWTSTSNSGTVGSSTSEATWGSTGLVGCSTSTLRLYCFQAPSNDPPRAAWPEPAALVFVRSGGTSGNLTGVEGADVSCQDQAAAAGLPGADSFVAWLSDTGTDAKNRLTIDGPWYRADGVRVAASKAALIDGNIDSAISYIASGAHLSAADRVWTGTFDGGTKSPDTCNSWFSFDSNLDGRVGSTDDTGYSWTNSSAFDSSCNNAGRWYCFGNSVVIFWDRFETGNVKRWSSASGAP